jgi:hypothetical protein
MIALLIMGAGLTMAAYGLLGRRNDHAALLTGAGGIIAGAAHPGPLGAANIALGVINIAGWWNRRRRDRACRAIGNKARALITAMTRRMRQPATQPA